MLQLSILYRDFPEEFLNVSLTRNEKPSNSFQLTYQIYTETDAAPEQVIEYESDRAAANMSIECFSMSITALERQLGAEPVSQHDTDSLQRLAQLFDGLRDQLSCNQSAQFDERSRMTSATTRGKLSALRLTARFPNAPEDMYEAASGLITKIEQSFEQLGEADLESAELRTQRITEESQQAATHLVSFFRLIQSIPPDPEVQRMAFAMKIFEDLKTSEMLLKVFKSGLPVSVADIPKYLKTAVAKPETKRL